MSRLLDESLKSGLLTSTDEFLVLLPVVLGMGDEGAALLAGVAVGAPWRVTGPRLDTLAVWADYRFSPSIVSVLHDVPDWSPAFPVSGLAKVNAARVSSAYFAVGTRRGLTPDAIAAAWLDGVPVEYLCTAGD